MINIISAWCHNSGNSTYLLHDRNVFFIKNSPKIIFDKNKININYDFSKKSSVFFEMSVKLFKTLLIFLFVNKSTQLSIECRFETTTHFYSINSLYSCEIEKIWNTEVPEIQFLNGTPQNGMNKNDVQQFVLAGGSSGTLKYFPTNLVDFFPNLISILIITSNDIAVISSEDLKPFDNLEAIAIQKSQITSIPSDLFKFNPKLKFVHISHNSQLSSIGKDLLTGLTSLTGTHFQHNKCISETAYSSDTILSLKDKFAIDCTMSSS